MSKNFELMQRAGKLLEIELPRPSEPPGPSPVPSISLPFTPDLAPAISPALGPPRTKKWKTRRASRRMTADQIAREESHRLVEHIFLAQTEEPPRVVVFAGIDHGNGCSSICAHTAEALQQNLAGTVCLLEANFRSPSLPKFYGLANHYGLTDALISEGPIRSFAKPVGKDNLYLMSSGSRVVDSHGLLNSDRLRIRFEELRNEFDFVVVDAPPMTRYSDAIAAPGKTRGRFCAGSRGQCYEAGGRCPGFRTIARISNSDSWGCSEQTDIPDPRIAVPPPLSLLQTGGAPVRSLSFPLLELINAVSDC